MRILVTGGLGFIGSNFILQTLNENPDYRITNLDAIFYGSNRKNLVQIENDPRYNFVKGDINNRKLIDKLIAKVDLVVNFAAESHVDRSINNPESFVRSNFFGVFNILEGIRRHKKKLIQISTDEVFGSLKKYSADESFKFNPSSPYASTKASAELLINSYFTTYNCDVKITRCTNNYGPRQFPEKLIPKTILLANKNRKIPLYGNGKNVRDWIFVSDHCDAILKVIERGRTGESYNIAANNEIDNMTVIRQILKLMKKSTKLIDFVKDRPGHDFRYSLDSNKIRKLGWKEKTSFEEGLKITVDWYLNNEKWWKGMPSNVLKQFKWNN